METPRAVFSPSVHATRTRRHHRLLRALVAILLPMALATGASAEERWFVVTIGGEPVGSVHEVVASDPGGGLRTRSRLRLVLNRLGDQVVIESSTEALESAEGTLQEVEAKLRTSDQETSVRAEMGPDAIVVHQVAGDRTFPRTVPIPAEADPLLGPEAIRRRTAAALTEVGDELRYHTFSGELGALTGAVRRVEAVEEVESRALRVRALRVEERLEASPLPTTLWIDPEGRVLHSQQTGPFGLVETRLAGAAEAALAAQGGELPEESYGATLVRTNVRIPRARSLEWLKLELRHRTPELGWPELDGPGQRVLEASPGRRVLAVERRDAPSGAPFPVAVTEANRRYLEPNAYLQSDDPALVAAARDAVGEETDLMAAVLALERWVAEAMSFDLGVVLAPSVEVFANRRGTCTEYAVLLATLTRAVGIPSRVVLGYVYVGGVFGGHAWVEVLAGDEWVPIDAAMVADGPADAARFAFQRTSLADGAGAVSLGAATQMFGQIDARILEIGLPGEPRRKIAEDAPAFTLEGGVFRDAGLGVALASPPGFTFAELDRAWPDHTVVALAGPAGEVVRLAVRQRLPWADPAAAAEEELARLVPEGEAEAAEVGGRPGFLADAGDRAAAAIPAGGETWLLSAEAPDAGALVRRAAEGLEIPRNP